MDMNKTNKKVSTLAATVAVATAFCGLCAGVATTVKAEAAPSNVQTSAATDNKVILSPGWNFVGGVKKLNTITDAGVEKADAATYKVDNAYICKLSVGETLPTPSSGREGMTFLGWRYSKDGELITIDTMPSATSGNVYLYANWKSDSISQGGGGGGGGGGEEEPDPAKVVTVNGSRMAKNPSPSETTVAEEYMLQGTAFEANATLEFKVDDAAITIDSIGNSSGIVKTGNTVSIGNKGGQFDIYLKYKKDGKWEIYAARKVDGGVVASAGNIYLAGNVDDRDLNWSSWPETGTKKGILVTGNTITIKLTQGDNCKFVKCNSTSSFTWQKQLNGAGTHITYNGGDMDNMEVNDTGTYTFTITAISGGLSVTVDAFEAA